MPFVELAPLCSGVRNSSQLWSWILDALNHCSPTLGISVATIMVYGETSNSGGPLWFLAHQNLTQTPLPPRHGSLGAFQKTWNILHDENSHWMLVFLSNLSRLRGSKRTTITPLFVFFSAGLGCMVSNVLVACWRGWWWDAHFDEEVLEHLAHWEEVGRTNDKGKHEPFSF